MNNMRIGYLNYADLATLTASPVADAEMPVTYLQNDSRSYVFGATSAASQDIKGTWSGQTPDSYTISEFALWFTNLAYNDTVRLILYPNADWTGTPIYDSTALAAWASGLFDTWGWGFINRYFTPAAAVKSFKITVAAAAAMQAGRLYLGPYVEPAVNPDEDCQIGWEGNSTQSRREGGSLAVDVKAKWRSFQFEMDLKTEAERAVWMEIGRYVMNEKTLVASLYPEVGGTSERDMAIMGKFEKGPLQKMAYNQYDFGLKLNEL